MGEFAFQTLRESITSAIRSKILTGELQPGVKLAEQKLAEEFGSSRAPIREALRQLEQEGMVEYSRNVGCSVRRVKPEDAYEIYLLRANLEMTALRYFDCKFPEEDLRTLRGILEEMRNVRPGDLSQIVENDNRFHAVIVLPAAPSTPTTWSPWSGCAARTAPYRQRTKQQNKGNLADRLNFDQSFYGNCRLSTICNYAILSK